MSRSIPFPRGWYAVPGPDFAPDGRTLSPVERAVIAAMVDVWRQGADLIRLGVPELERRTGYGERALDGARRSLVERKLVAVVDPGGKGRGSCAVYQLSPAVLGKGAPFRGHPVPGKTNSRLQKGAKKGAQKPPDLEERSQGGPMKAPPIPVAPTWGKVGAA